MIPFIAQRPEHRILKQLEFHFASICIILLPIQMFELDRAQKPHFLQSTRNIFTFSFIQTTNWTLSIYIFPFTKYFWSHSFFLPKNCCCANRTLLSHQRTGRRKKSERGRMMKRGRTIKYRLYERHFQLTFFLKSPFLYIQLFDNLPSSLSWMLEWIGYILSMVVSQNQTQVYLFLHFCYWNLTFIHHYLLYNLHQSHINY